MQTIRATSTIAFLSGAFALVPASMRAQGYLTPLVTPPAAVGECARVAMARQSRADSLHVTGRRLVVHGAHLGEQRQITVYVRNGRPTLFMDAAFVVNSAISSMSGHVLARLDSAGGVRGQRLVGMSVLPDSVLTMRHDVVALHRVAAQSKNIASHAPLSAAEQARVREMTAWLLKRCP
jgi:hypothetical protein